MDMKGKFRKPQIAIRKCISKIKPSANNLSSLALGFIEIYLNKLNHKLYTYVVIFQNVIFSILFSATRFTLIELLSGNVNVASPKTSPCDIGADMFSDIVISCDTSLPVPFFISLPNIFF